MWQQSQIDFQLKLKTLQGSVESKIMQIQSISLLIKNIDSAKIESEDEIIELVAKIHGSIGNLSKIILDIKDFCYELGLGSFYDLFKQIFAIMGASIKLLAESCQYGVERSLIKFKSDRMKQAAQTQCTDLKNQCKTQALYHTSVIKRMNQTQELSNIEINKIYQNIQEQKQAILRIAPSNAAMKINEVEIGWMRIIHDYNEILAEVSRESGNDEYGQKIYKPQHLSKVLKQELWQSIKSYFKDFIFKTVQKFHTQFYTHQVAKLRVQIQNQKPQKKCVSSQTDIEGFKQLKQINKDKKTLQKISKQLKQVIGQKNDLAQQFNKVSKANEALNNKVQEIQKRLSKGSQTIPSLRTNKLEKKLSIVAQRDSFLKNNLSRFNQKNLYQQQSMQHELPKNSDVKEQIKISQQDGNQQNVNQNSANLIEQILKKKRNMKIVYSKGKKFRQNNQILNNQKVSIANEDTTISKNNESQRSIKNLKVFDGINRQNQIRQSESSVKQTSAQQNGQKLLIRKSYQINSQKRATNSYDFFVKQFLKNGLSCNQRDMQHFLQSKLKTNKKQDLKDEVSHEDKIKIQLLELSGEPRKSHLQRSSVSQDRKTDSSQIRKNTMQKSNIKKISQLQKRNQLIFKTKNMEKFQNDDNVRRANKKKSYTPRGPQRFDRLNIQEHKSQNNQKLIKESIQNACKGKQENLYVTNRKGQENTSEVQENSSYNMIRIRKISPQTQRTHDDESTHKIVQICRKYNFEEKQIKNLIGEYIMDALAHQQRKNFLFRKQEIGIKNKYRSSKMETC